MKEYFDLLVTLSKGQNGYDVVSNFIKNYWEQNKLIDTVVVNLETSYNGKDFSPVHDVASPTYDFSDIEFDYDWWEGEKYIRLKGIKYLHELNIEGGIYT